MGDRVCAGISPLLTFCEMYSPLQTKEKDMFIKKITPALYKKHKELLSHVCLLTTNVHLGEAGL